MKEFNKSILENKKAILFDSDGTILNNSNIWNEIYAEFVNEVCGVLVSNEEILQDWHEHQEAYKDGDFYESHIKYLVKKHGNGKVNIDIDKLVKIKKQISERFVCEKVEYKENAPEVIARLKELGYVLGLGAICDKETFKKYNYKNQNIVSKMNCFEEFDKILVYEDVKKKKPDPEVYIKLMEELNVKPEECLIIEDSLTGVQAGKNAGVEVLNIPDECSRIHQSEIDQITDYKLNNMKELFDTIN